MKLDHVLLQSGVVVGTSSGSARFGSFIPALETAAAGLTPQFDTECLMHVKHVLDVWSPRKIRISLLVPKMTMKWSDNVPSYAFEQVCVALIGVRHFADHAAPIDEISCFWIRVRVVES